MLSTAQTRRSIQQLQSLVNGGFTDRVSVLDNQGRILSSPDLWFGPLVTAFRFLTEPEKTAELDKANWFLVGYSRRALAAR